MTRAVTGAPELSLSAAIRRLPRLERCSVLIAERDRGDRVDDGIHLVHAFPQRASRVGSRCDLTRRTSNDHGPDAMPCEIVALDGALRVWVVVPGQKAYPGVPRWSGCQYQSQLS